MGKSDIRDELGRTISRLVRLARSIKEEEAVSPPIDDKPTVDELILENRILQRKVEEVHKWKLENYSTSDIEKELVRRRKKMELQRNSPKNERKATP